MRRVVAAKEKDSKSREENKDEEEQVCALGALVCKCRGKEEKRWSKQE